MQIQQQSATPVKPLNLPLPPPRLVFVLLGLGYYGLLLPALVLVPRWFPLPADIASASAAQGYNNQVAYLVAVGWVLCGVVCFTLLERKGLLATPLGDQARSVAPPADRPAKSTVWLELLLILGGVLVVYFPLALARYGPFMEDTPFFNALHRMHAGQVPYRDFEFLYGPLMLHLTHGWMSLFGFSLTSFYSYLALLEGLSFGALLLVVNHYYPQRLARWCVFLAFAILLLNPLLAPHKNGLRIFLPLLILLLFTARPGSKGVLVGGSVLLGLQMSYSHEYGVATAAAIFVLYLFLFAVERQSSRLRDLVVVILDSALTWSSVCGFLLGGAFGDYVRETLSLTSRWSAGEAAFTHYWTANSLSVFGLICLATILVGRLVARGSPTCITPRDRLLLCGLVYALVVLKSGITRCDMWHLDPAVLVIVLAFLLPNDGGVCAITPKTYRLAWSLTCILAITYLVGLLPFGSFYARGLWRGSLDWWRGSPVGVAPVPTLRAPSVALEHTHPDPSALELGRYLADETRRDRPILFYGDLCHLNLRAGVYKFDHLNDDWLYSKERGQRVRNLLVQHPHAIVVITRARYERLQARPGSAADRDPLTITYDSLTKAVGAWLSSVHFAAVPVEHRALEERWRRLVGDYVNAHYHRVAEFGPYLVLMTGQQS